MGIDQLRATAVCQRGLFTRRQARDCGFSADQIRRRLSSGVWRPVRGTVLAESGLRLTAPLRERAVLLIVSGAILAGPSAARVWGLPVVATETFVAVARPRRPLAGVKFLVGQVPPRDRVYVDGLLVTSRETTVFDCLRLLPEEAALDLLDRALQQQWITMAELSARATAMAGRRGIAQVVRLIRVVAGGHRFAAERRCAGLLADAGIRGWAANAEIHDTQGLIGLGDLVFVKSKVVVEVDGWAYHVTPERFQRDRERQNRLIAAGWTVLRFTWRDLSDRPGYVVATVQGVLGRQQDRRYRDASPQGTPRTVTNRLILAKPRVGSVTGGGASGSRLWPTSL